MRLKMIALRAMASFGCRENGLPRRYAPRNDRVFVCSSADFGATSHQISVSLRASAYTGVAIRFPTMRSIVSAVADNKLLDKLEFERGEVGCQALFFGGGEGCGQNFWR